MVKVCSKCKIEKSLEMFYKDKTRVDGRQYTCKECRKYITKTTNDRHRKRYYQENKEKIKKTNENYRLENWEKVKKRMAKQHVKKRREDIKYRLKTNLRSRINMAIKKGWKSGSSVKDLGCSVEYLKKHLESKFQEGMSWDNYGYWHIDHIKPLSKFDLTKREDFLEACNYKNLQPLWARENIKKGNK